MSRPKGPPSQAILIWIPIQLYKDLKIERRETGKFDTLSELIRVWLAGIRKPASSKGTSKLTRHEKVPQANTGRGRRKADPNIPLATPRLMLDNGFR